MGTISGNNNLIGDGTGQVSLSNGVNGNLYVLVATYRDPETGRNVRTYSNALAVARQNVSANTLNSVYEHDHYSFDDVFPNDDAGNNYLYEEGSISENGNVDPTSYMGIMPSTVFSGVFVDVENRHSLINGYSDNIVGVRAKANLTDPQFVNPRQRNNHFATSFPAINRSGNVWTQGVTVTSLDRNRRIVSRILDMIGEFERGSSPVAKSPTISANLMPPVNLRAVTTGQTAISLQWNTIATACSILRCKTDQAAFWQPKSWV